MKDVKPLLFHLLIIYILTTLDVSATGGFLGLLIYMDIPDRASAKGGGWALGTTHCPEQDYGDLIQ